MFIVSFVVRHLKCLHFLVVSTDAFINMQTFLLGTQLEVAMMRNRSHTSSTSVGSSKQFSNAAMEVYTTSTNIGYLIAHSKLIKS